MFPLLTLITNHLGILEDSDRLTPVAVNRFPNKLTPNVPKTMPRNPPLCSFALFLIVSLTPFDNKPDSLRDLTIFMISSISSFEIIVAVNPEPKIFFSIAAFVAHAATVNPNGLSTFFIKDKPVFL